MVWATRRVDGRAKRAMRSSLFSWWLNPKDKFGLGSEFRSDWKDKTGERPRAGRLETLRMPDQGCLALGVIRPSSEGIAWLSSTGWRIRLWLGAVFDGTPSSCRHQSKTHVLTVLPEWKRHRLNTFRYVAWVDQPTAYHRCASFPMSR